MQYKAACAVCSGLSNDSKASAKSAVNFPFNKVMLFPCRSEPAPVRINWASLNANREQVEAEKWAGKALLCFIIRALRASWYLSVWVVGYTEFMY